MMSQGKQIVYLSRSQSGRVGFFTNGTMALNLLQYENVEKMTDDQLAQIAARYGFAYDASRRNA